MKNYLICPSHMKSCYSINDQYPVTGTEIQELINYISVFKHVI